MSAPELKPCPFCGKSDTVDVESDNTADDWIALFCMDCGAIGPKNYSLPHASIAWNTRVTDTRLADAEAMAEAALRLVSLSATRTRAKPDQADAIIEAATVELAVAVEAWRAGK